MTTEISWFSTYGGKYIPRFEKAVDGTVLVVVDNGQWIRSLRHKPLIKVPMIPLSGSRAEIVKAITEMFSTLREAAKMFDNLKDVPLYLYGVASSFDFDMTVEVGMILSPCPLEPRFVEPVEVRSEGVETSGLPMAL